MATRIIHSFKNKPSEHFKKWMAVKVSAWYVVQAGSVEWIDDDFLYVVEQTYGHGYESLSAFTEGVIEGTNALNLKHTVVYAVPKMKRGRPAVEIVTEVIEKLSTVKRDSFRLQKKREFNEAVSEMGAAAMDRITVGAFAIGEREQMRQRYLDLYKLFTCEFASSETCCVTSYNSDIANN